MKRVASQLVVAVVCGFLGFLLTYQFKLLNTKDELTNSYENSDILQEVESLKKEKEELEEANATLNEEIKALEDKATSEGELEAEIKKKLDNARMQLGLVDVKGPGIIITLTPKTSIFGTNTSDSVRTITDDELVYLVNTLWYSRAEAISINDIRITPQTGIKNAGSSISIGSAGRVDPSSEIVIKVIGDKSKLNVGVSYGGSLETGALKNYTNDVKSSDEITIIKTTQTLKWLFNTSTIGVRFMIAFIGLLLGVF